MSPKGSDEQYLVTYNNTGKITFSSFSCQVDLAEVKNVSGVATQGSVMGTWVTKYMLNYSSDGYQWETYSNHTDSGPQVGTHAQMRFHFQFYSLVPSVRKTWDPRLM